MIVYLLVYGQICQVSSGWFSSELVANILSFCSVIGIYIGLWFAYNALSEFKSYRKAQRSSNAAKILALIRSAIEYIVDISLAPQSYSYPHFDENLLVSTLPKEDLQPFKAKPPRLIENKLKELKNDLYEPIAQIGGEEESEAIKLMDELKRRGIRIASAVYYKLEENTEFLQSGSESQDKKSLEDILKDPKNYLNVINERAERILKPIIEGKK